MKKNYKEEILTVEIEGEINGKKLIAKGVDEKDATEKFSEIYAKEIL